MSSEPMSPHSLWEKVTSNYAKVGREGIKQIVTLYYLVIDPTVSALSKVAAVAALSYFVMPLDAIPDFLIGVGYTDDITAVTAAIASLFNTITADHQRQAEETVSGWFGTQTSETREINNEEQQ